MTLHPPHLLCDNYITSSIQKYAVLSHFRGKKAAYFFAMRAKIRPVDEFLL